MQIVEPVDTQSQPDAQDRAYLRNESAKVFILLGLAVYFAYNIISGDLTNYINVRFAWLSYVAVLIFGLMGGASAYTLYRRDFSPTYDGHMGPLHWSVIAITAIPLLMGTLIPSQPLGASAIDGEVSLTVSTVNAAAAFSREPLQRNVLDWLRVFSTETTPATFDGQQADFSGFVYREPDFPDDHFMVARFTVSCCVADAQPIGLPVYAPDAANIADGEWVRVTGDFEAAFFRDIKVPVLQAASLAVIDQPQHPYLYP